MSAPAKNMARRRSRFAYLTLLIRAPLLFLSQSVSGFQFALPLCFTLQGFVLFQFTRCVKKCLLRSIQGIRVGCGPFSRLRQSCPAIQRTGVMIQQLPFIGCFGQMPMKQQAFAICAQPITQPGPLADEGLVSNLCGIFARGNQTSIRQDVQHGAHLIGLSRLGYQFRDRRAAAGVFRAFAQLRQPQENVAGAESLFGRELLINGFRRCRRWRRAPRPNQHILSTSDVRPLRRLPSFEQGMRHQRQRARFIAHIAQDQIDQAWLKVIATALGRFLESRGATHRPSSGRYRFAVGRPHRAVQDTAPDGHRSRRES